MRVFTEEHRRNISLAMTGVNKGRKLFFTETHKKNISISAKKRLPQTEEKINRIRIAMKLFRQRNPLSSETIEKIASKLRGIPHSEELNRKVSESLKGERNPRWRGGVTEATKKIRYSREGRVWRKAVLERDNYLCGHCKGNKELMEAHHVKEFHHHPELRFDVDNGLALCNPCHIKHHNNRSKII